MSEKFAWYLARSSGWVAFVLLAVTVVWGILGITKIIERKGLPRWMLDLHRHIALLTVISTGVHLAALVADNWLQIAWKEILVPMTISYRPGAVAWGVVAMYLIAAVQITSWCKSRIPRRVWRGVHWLSYPALWMVAVHGLQAGTDAKAMPVRVGVMVITAAVALVTLMRVFKRGRKRVVVPPTAAPTAVQFEVEVDQPPSADPVPTPRLHVPNDIFSPPVLALSPTDFSLPTRRPLFNRPAPVTPAPPVVGDDEGRTLVDDASSRV